MLLKTNSCIFVDCAELHNALRLKIVQTKFIKREVRLFIQSRRYPRSCKNHPPAIGGLYSKKATVQAGRLDRGLSQKTCLMQH